MKCTEVMEWMHRYLDHDLSPDETIEMYRHIDNCPSCAEVFDRLVMLSEQLEQLPDVKPPFSLVDSIMPQLEKIDLGVQGADAATLEDATVVPMTRKSTHGKAVKGASRGASMATRTGIGAVAAAIILLIAVFNMPDSMPAADVEKSLNQAADIAGSSEAMSKMTAENSETATTDTTDTTNTNAGSNEVGVQFSEADNAGDASGADSAAPAAVDAGPAAEATEPAPAVSQGPAVSQEPALSKKNTSAPRKGEAATPAPRADTRVGSGSKIAQDAKPSAEDDMTADSANTQQDSGQLPASEEAGVMSLLPTLGNQFSWNSPDWKYTAELDGQQLVIYSLPSSRQQEDRTAVTSLPLEGTWKSGTWSADSLQFTYVTVQDGAEITKVYTIPAAASPGAPSASPSASPDASATALPGNK